VSYTATEWPTIEPLARNAEVQARSHPERRDLFLCHAWDDRTGAARELYDLLVSLGATVWFSETEVGLGTSLLREIDRGLATSRIGIVLVTPALLKSLGAQGVADKELSALLRTDRVILVAHGTTFGKYSARATGDVIAARAHGEPVRDEPWDKHATTAHHRAVPQVIFTDPEVTTVGLTAADAEQAGYRTRVVDVDIAVAGAAIHARDYTGWAQMVVDEDRRVVIGMTIVGQDVADLLQSATIAVVGEVPLERLWHAAPSFPQSARSGCGCWRTTACDLPVHPATGHPSERGRVTRITPARVADVTGSPRNCGVSVTGSVRRSGCDALIGHGAPGCLRRARSGVPQESQSRSAGRGTLNLGQSRPRQF
jgi:hypothetical protein